ncbi:glutathione synthase (plasmid) [Streptomyces sp. NBC_01591]|uniref:ATP-grasp domain-containing protein n=1 Tax=Streptomyces sp. NBC_01591 TaxID=2975888 RepID=UPI002DDA61C9|nr:glutathione synthase [Streptomyces sp. NBC_01591]WSD73882.1 glutathione synthase [Streptomyces sp. NBC_01591]
MPYKILVLVSGAEEFELDNQSLVPSALLRDGHDVHIGNVHTLALHDSVLVCDRTRLTAPIAPGDPFPAPQTPHGPTEDFDLVWVLAGPHPDAGTEYFQLLWLLNQRVPFVNGASALFFLNSKVTLGALVPPGHRPSSYVSNDSGFLGGLVSDVADRPWILKPPNEGCGADVYVVSAQDRNSAALLSSATGNATSRYDSYGRTVIGKAERYAVLQEYLPHARTHEKRVILAGENPVSGYLRFPLDNDNRANATIGARYERLQLTPDEETFVRAIGKQLRDHGIHFAGIDLAYPHVIEVNLENPAGLCYHQRATGEDQSTEAVRAVLDSLRTAGKLP